MPKYHRAWRAKRTETTKIDPSKTAQDEIRRVIPEKPCYPIRQQARLTQFKPIIAPKPVITTIPHTRIKPEVKTEPKVKTEVKPKRDKFAKLRKPRVFKLEN